MYLLTSVIPSVNFSFHNLFLKGKEKKKIGYVFNIYRLYKGKQVKFFFFF